MTEELTAEQELRKRKKSSLYAVRQATLLFPFVKPYLGMIGVLFLSTLLLGASEGGRAVLIEPLLNKVFLANNDSKDAIKIRFDYGLNGDFDAVLQKELKSFEPELKNPELAPSAAVIMKDPYLTLGPPLSPENLTNAGRILDDTRKNLLLLARDLDTKEPAKNRIWPAFSRGIFMQKKARSYLKNPRRENMAIALSLEARKANYEAAFHSAWDTLKWVVLAAAGFALILSVSQFFSQYLGRILVAKIVIDIQNALAKHLISQELSYFEGGNQGEFFSRLTNDVSTTAIALDVMFSAVLTHPIRLVFFLIMAIYFSPMLSLSIVLLGGSVILPVRYIGKKIRRKARRRQQSAAEAVGAMQQMLSGIRTVKAFDREEFEAARFRERTIILLHHGISVIKSRLMARSFLNLINNLTIPLVFLGGGLLILKNIGGVDTGSFAGFVTIVVMMYMPAKQLAKAWTQLQDASAGIERVFELFDKKATIKDAPDAIELAPISKSIEYKGVCFSYDKKIQILHDISFTTPVDTQTAIVGGTGHGKSTLVDLIPRFIEADKGEILIDGVDIRKGTRQSLLAQIAIVTQDAFLFNDTIANNIRYGRLDASDDEIREVAKKAQIHDEIMAMKDGYASVVGDRGSLLSGGQIQRVTIARALLRNPKILILDEATSGLDTATEQAVQAAFDELKSGRTAFVIAHRLSTIRNVDQILVLNKGHIVEQGTYDDLVAQDGVFTKLARAQALDHVLESESVPNTDVESSTPAG
ncbi:MAG: ABC transporter ATP-binding protein [Planctomycetota bacterium]|nr:ABC transporter ATP-binding protein [Planctomycetota bacterium]